MQPYPSADNCVKALLSKALPTRARLSISHHKSPPLGSLHKPLSLFQQKANKRNKNNSPTVNKTKTTLQKVNQHEKAESYIQDEGQDKKIPGKKRKTK